MSSLLVTGGAGFIGSHIVDRAVKNGTDVKVLDNLSAGCLSNLSLCGRKKSFRFIKGDLGNSASLGEALKDVKTVVHMAANPDVRTGFENPKIAYDENIRKTFSLLEKIRKTDVETVLFASSSVVYGEPKIIPTPENYGPLLPISAYGASKMACEALVSSYCYNYGITGLIMRLANVIGSRSKHGVIWDFITKLMKHNKKLEVLGNGKQTKSYIHVNDCVNCFFFCLSKATRGVEVYNVGNSDRIDVISIARIVCRNMNLKNVKLVTTGGVDGGGWVGDVRKMCLDITKLKDLGWRPTLSSKKTVDLACREMLKETYR
jgi:UDP-glucose 4-epimerase